MPDAAVLSLPEVDPHMQDIIWFCKQSPLRLNSSHFSLHHYFLATQECLWFHQNFIKVDMHHNISKYWPFLSLTLSSGSPSPRKSFLTSHCNPQASYMPPFCVPIHLSIFFVEFSILLKLFGYLSIIPTRLQ